MDTTRTLLILLAIAATGCSGGDAGASGAATPPRGGHVWEVQATGDRGTVPGAIVAFVNGIHVMVVDGDRIFAGMTELKATNGAQGETTIAFPSGLSAQMVPSAGGVELRFSSGERVTVRERAEAE